MLHSWQKIAPHTPLQLEKHPVGASFTFLEQFGWEWWWSAHRVLLPTKPPASWMSHCPQKMVVLSLLSVIQRLLDVHAAG
jgi:hypothetical protein